jgi:hypothetical protein
MDKHIFVNKSCLETSVSKQTSHGNIAKFFCWAQEPEEFQPAPCAPTGWHPFGHFKRQLFNPFRRLFSPRFTCRMLRLKAGFP